VGCRAKRPCLKPTQLRGKAIIEQAAKIQSGAYCQHFHGIGDSKQDSPAHGSQSCK
jgi:hypothetical protein